MNFLYFVLMCYGITQILTQGKIFDSIRPKYYYFHCPMCVGVPIGMLIFIMFWFCGIVLFPNLYIGSIFFGFISSATSYGLMSLIKEDGFKINL